MAVKSFWFSPLLRGAGGVSLMILNRALVLNRFYTPLNPLCRGDF